MAGFSPANRQKCCQWLNGISCTDLTMHRISIHRPAGHWPKEKAADALILDFDARHRRRIRLTTDQGEDVLLDLPRAVAMADGDGLQLEDGTWLKVQAAAELIVEVRHAVPTELLRLAWHLGNRHLPTEIRHQVLRIRPDHVIEDMLLGFGADLVKVEAPFQPEGGAYSGRGHHHRNHDDSGHHHE
jgi:urease accessory protein